MPPRLPSNLLDRSAEEASRLLSLSYLDQIDLAHVRLGDQLDQEALHDFRVGIRRLSLGHPGLSDGAGGQRQRQDAPAAARSRPRDE